MSMVMPQNFALVDELEQEVSVADPARTSLAMLLQMLEWKGSLNEFVEHLPLDMDSLSIDSIRDTLLKLGYASRIRKGRIDRIPESDLPTIAFLKNGSTVVLDEYTIEGLDVYEGREKVDLPASQSLQWLELQPKPRKPAQRGVWFQELMTQYNAPFTAVFILSLVNAILGLALPLFTMSVYDFLIPSGSISGLITIGLGAFIALLWMVVSNRVRSRILSRAAANVNYQVGRSLFSKLVRSPAEFLMQTSSFQNVARIRDIDRVREFLGGTMAISLFDTPFIVVSMVAIAWLSGWLVLVPLFGIIIYAILAIYFSNRLGQVSKNASKVGQRSQYSQRQALDGLTELRQSGEHSEWLKQYANDTVRSSRANFIYRMASAAQQVAGRSVNMMIALGTLMTGIYMVLTNAMTAGGLIAAMMLIWRVTGPLQVAFFSMSRLKQFKQSVRQINAIMDSAYEQPLEKDFATIRGIAPTLTIDRVVYRYSSERDAALNGVALQIEAGQKVALVGPNGTGKSTLLSCIAGLYHPQAGSIKLDGHDIRQFRAVDYRNKVGYLTREPDFIEGTVRDNLRAAAPLVSDERMCQALEQFGVGKYLADLHDGLDTPLMEKAHLLLDRKVAIGISLARIALRDPDIVLCDDVYDGSDHPVMKALIEYVEQLPSGKTLIYATHDNDLMLMADRAAIMDQGTVAQIADLNQEKDEETGEQVA